MLPEANAVHGKEGLGISSLKCPRRDLNPCYRRERPVSWAELDDGDRDAIAVRVASAVGLGDGQFVYQRPPRPATGARPAAPRKACAVEDARASAVRGRVTRQPSAAAVVSTPIHHRAIASSTSSKGSARIVASPS